MTALKRVWSFVWRAAVCTAAFVMGMGLGSGLAGAILPKLGFNPPALPAGTDQATLGTLFLYAGIFMALGAIMLAQGLRGSFLRRWLVLAFLVWVVYGLNTALEASFFSSMDVASPSGNLYNLTGSLFSALLLGAAAAGVTASKGEEGRFGDFFRGRKPGEWAWRLAAAWTIFPAVYLFFGQLISPVVLPYYQQNMAGLTLPTVAQIIPLQFVRSTFLLLATLPVVAFWQGSRRSLFLSLGGTLFVLTGVLTVVVGYWLPSILRVVHGMELLADAMVYAAAVVWLLAPEQSAKGKLGV